MKDMKDVFSNTLFARVCIEVTNFLIFTPNYEEHGPIREKLLAANDDTFNVLAVGD